MTMKHIYYLIGGAVLLAINNIAVIYFVKSTPYMVKPEDSSLVKTISEHHVSEKDPPLWVADADSELSRHSQPREDLQQDLLVEVIQNQLNKLIDDGILDQIIDNYFAEQHRQSIQNASSYAELKTISLLETLFSPDSPAADKSGVLNALLANNSEKINELNSYELNQLISTGQRLDDNMGGLMLERIYKKRPEIIKTYVDQLSVEDIGHVENLLTNNSELAELFYQKNLDEILVSEDYSVFDIPAHGVHLEMSLSQEQALAGFFGSESKAKRDFAFSLLHSFQSWDTLQSAFSDIANKRDKMNFILMIYHRSNDADKKQWARDMASQNDLDLDF